MAKWLPRLVPILPDPETRAVISVMTRRPDKSSNLSPYRFATWAHDLWGGIFRLVKSVLRLPSNFFDHGGFLSVFADTDVFRDESSPVSSTRRSITSRTRKICSIGR